MAAHGIHHPRKVISYAPFEVASVEEMLLPKKPLVKSCLPVTRPKAPSFENEEEMRRRKQEKEERKAQDSFISMKLEAAIEAERKVIKAQLELEREKKLTLQTIYRMARTEEYKKSHPNSPFLLDLAAECDRAEAIERMRAAEARRMHKLMDKRKQELHTAVAKAAGDKDEAEERRRLHRQTLETTKLANSYKDVMKAEMTGTKRPHSQERVLRGTFGSESPTSPSIPREEPIADQAARQKKDVPVYIAQRQQELAERARLEEQLKQGRIRLLKEQQEAEELRLRQEMEEKERQRIKKERMEKKKADELAQRRNEIQMARQKVEAEIRNQIEMENTEQKIKEAKKSQLAAEWRSQALRNKRGSASEKMQLMPIPLFPTPPRVLPEKTAAVEPIHEPGPSPSAAPDQGHLHAEAPSEPLPTLNPDTSMITKEQNVAVAVEPSAAPDAPQIAVGESAAHLESTERAQSATKPEALDALDWSIFSDSLDLSPAQSPNNPVNETKAERDLGFSGSNGADMVHDEAQGNAETTETFSVEMPQAVQNGNAEEDGTYLDSSTPNGLDVIQDQTQENAEDLAASSTEKQKATNNIGDEQDESYSEVDANWSPQLSSRASPVVNRSGDGTGSPPQPNHTVQEAESDYEDDMEFDSGGEYEAIEDAEGDTTPAEKEDTEGIDDDAEVEGDEGKRPRMIPRQYPKTSSADEVEDAE